MYQHLDRITLKSGETVDAGVVRGPDLQWAPARGRASEAQGPALALGQRAGPAHRDGPRRVLLRAVAGRRSLRQHHDHRAPRRGAPRPRLHPSRGPPPGGGHAAAGPPHGRLPPARRPGPVPGHGVRLPGVPHLPGPRLREHRAGERPDGVLHHLAGGVRAGLLRSGRDRRGTGRLAALARLDASLRGSLSRRRARRRPGYVGAAVPPRGRSCP